MARNRGSSLSALIVAVSLVVGGELPGEGAWEDSLPDVARHLGSVWCGTTHGQLQLGPRAYTIFGYQIVQPDYEDFVLHLIPISISLKDPAAGAQFLRITHRHDKWLLQSTGADPHPFVPSSAVKRALRFGTVFGLPANPSLRIVAGEEPQTFQIVTEDPILLFRGIEGKLRLIVESTTKFPLRLSVFGLREWQGKEIADYKLSLTFNTFIGCRKPT